MSSIRNPQLQKSLGPEFLHRVALVMVLRTASTLGCSCCFQFGDDLVDCRGGAFNRMRDWATA